ncbi:CU044_5270 family protein [Nonomuraea sp. SBT364]|uniref:CU044_5270 family protein n=1 Tax=Nonomuraea sp. SBT364 TaxID=1580530 RepID=UPI000A8286F1|nr:CU044_5270 family protein [Nonomuraea sp. SBT364]
MNPMDELRAARPAHLGDVPVDEGTRAKELTYAMSRPRPARRRARKLVRPVWGISLAGAAAAVAAATVVVTGTGGTTPRAPDPVAQPGQTATATPTAAKVRLSAREVLLAAAEKAGSQPDEMGAWWHTTSVHRTLFEAAKGGYLVLDQQRSETWTPSATGGDQWGRTRSLGARPATAADEAAWQRAGSPTEIDVKVWRKLGGMRLSTSPGKPSEGHTPLVDGDKVFWLGRNVTMKELRALPSDPGELKAWLLRSYKGHDTETSSIPMGSDAWLFRVSTGLITDMPVTPEVRAAAFRMLADLDSVEVIENVTDAEGRQGTAVAVEEKLKDGVLENRLIFDQETGRTRATESVVVEPGGAQAAFEPGTVWNSVAVLEAGWTDSRS